MPYFKTKNKNKQTQTSAASDPKYLIPTEKIIGLAKSRGVDFGPGDPNERIRYFIKLGILPHAIRRAPERIGNWKLPAPYRTCSGAGKIGNSGVQATVGHLPVSAVDKLLAVENLKNSGLTFPQIAKKLAKQEEAQTARRESKKLSEPKPIETKKSGLVIYQKVGITDEEIKKRLDEHEQKIKEKVHEELASAITPQELKEDLIPTSEVVKEAEVQGVDFGPGDANERIRYFIKLGILPHAVRKTRFDSPLHLGKIEGHLPKWSIKRLLYIYKLYHRGLSFSQIAAKIKHLPKTSPIRPEPPPPPQPSAPSELSEPSLTSPPPRRPYFTSAKAALAVLLLFIGVISTIVYVANLKSNNKEKLVQQVQRSQKLGEVLAATSKEHKLYIDADIEVSGTSLFKENITAPNIIYSVTGGDGIEVTGGQNPIVSLAEDALVKSLNETTGELTIKGSGTNTVSTSGSTITITGSGLTSESDTLATVTGRGATTSTALTLSGLVTFGSGLTVSSGLTTLSTTGITGAGLSTTCDATTGKLVWSSTTNLFSCGSDAGASGTTLQASYDASTSPEITVDSTRGALTIRDAASAIGANLFEVQNNGGTTNYFAVTSSGISTSGDLTVSGNDITFGNGESISNQTDGTISLNPTTFTLSGTTTFTASSLTAFNCSDCIDFDDIGDSLTLDAATTIAAGSSNSLTITSSLSSGARSSDVLIISQADNGTNDSTEDLLQITQLDQASTGDGIEITYEGGGVPLRIVKPDRTTLVLNPSQFILIDNQENASSTIDDGILIQSAGQVITDGLDVSDSDLTNALNVGANTITGAGYLITSTASGLTVNSTSANLALQTTTSGDITATTGAATGLFNILTGNLKVGNGTPGVTLDGEDAYIEGTFEVDGATTLDGTLTINGIATANTDVNFAFAGSENLAITNTTATASPIELTLTSTTNNISGIGIVLTNNDTTGITEYGFNGAHNSTQVIADGVSPTLYGIYQSVTKTGNDTTTNSQVIIYGIAASASNTVAAGVDNGTRVTFAGHFTATGDTEGTNTAYGIFATATGADTNYGLNIGAISTAQTANYGIYVAGVSGATTNYSILVDAGDAIFDANVVVGGSTSRTETLANTGFVMGGDDLFVAGMAGFEGSLYTDGSFITGATTTYADGSITVSGTSFDLDVATGGEIALNELGADVDVRIEGDTATSLFVADAALDAVQLTPSGTRASATSATWDAIDVKATTATITGSTAITTATGFNLINIAQPTLSAGTALTVTNAATLYIANAPTGGGAGPATITNAYSLWVDAGTTRLDGDLVIGGTCTGCSGGVAWSAISAPTTSLSLTFDDAEVNTFTISSDTEDFWTFNAASLSSGSLLVGTGHATVGITDALVKLSTNVGAAGSVISASPYFSGSAATGYGIYLAGTDATTAANVDYNFFSSLAASGNLAANTAGTYYGIYGNVTKTGTDTANTTNTTTRSFGVYGVGTNTASTDDAEILRHTYGGYFNGAGNTNSTSIAYGIYATATGADTNYAGVFSGDISATAASGNTTDTNFNFIPPAGLTSGTGLAVTNTATNNTFLTGNVAKISRALTITGNQTANSVGGAILNLDQTITTSSVSDQFNDLGGSVLKIARTYNAGGGFPVSANGALIDATYTVTASGGGFAFTAPLMKFTSDINSSAAIGLQIKTADGNSNILIDAIDVTDSDITNAINVGANIILGTTANINFDNFDVNGTSGKTDWVMAATGQLTINATSTPNTTTSGVIDLNVTNSQDASSGINLSFTSAAAGATTQYGQFVAYSNATATTTDITNTSYAMYLSNSRTGADTATGHTVNVYGVASLANLTQSSGAGTGTRNIYGGYFSAIGDTEGTQNTFGIYATASGGNNNYAGVFLNGNVGIGDATPIEGQITINDNNATQDLIDITSDAIDGENIIDITSTGLTTGKIINITGPINWTSGGGTGDVALSITTDVANLGRAIGSKVTFDQTGGSTSYNLVLDTTNTPSTNGQTMYGLYSTITDNSSIASKPIGVGTLLTLTGNIAKSAYGLYGAITSTSTTADILLGADLSVDQNAASASGNKTQYGLRAQVTNDGITDGAGTHNIFGGYFSTVGNAGGTSTSYGVYGAPSGSDNNYGLTSAAISTAGSGTNSGLVIGNLSAAAGAVYGINIGTLGGGTGSNVYGINSGALTSVASGINAQLNLGTVSGTANSSNNYGIRIDAISSSGTSTVNYGLTIGNLSGATTSKGIEIGTLSSATSTGITIGALSGNTADTGISIGAITGSGTGTGIDITSLANTGTSNYGLKIGTITGASSGNYGIWTGTLTAVGGAVNTGLNIGAMDGTAVGSSNYGINVGGISANTANPGNFNYGINVGGISGSAASVYGLNIGAISAGTAKYGINIAQITSATSTTSYGINIGGFTAAAGTATVGVNIVASAATATNNYGINIGALTGAGTTNYGIYVGSVSGATNNYGIYVAGGETVISVTTTQATERLCGTHSDATAGVSIIRDCNPAGQADLAEYYGSDGALATGEIVALDPNNRPQEVLDPSNGKTSTKAWVVKSAKTYDSTTIGIVSTNPFSEILGDGLFADDEYPVPIAMAGRVPTKISLENGPIKAGDMVTSSSTAGVGMKATKVGRTIGVALESFEPTDGSNQGSIVVFVEPGWYLGSALANGSIENPPTVELANDSNIQISELPIDELGRLIRDGKLDGQILTAEQIMALVDQRVDEKLASLQAGEDPVQSESTKSALLADSSEASGSTRLAEENEKTLDELNKLLATTDLSIDTLGVNGQTRLAQTQVAGTFSQDGTLIIDYGRQINVLGSTLFLQNDSLAGCLFPNDPGSLSDDPGSGSCKAGILVDIGVGAAIFDKDGNLRILGTLTAKSLETEEIAINIKDVGSSSVGSTSIEPGSSRLTIATTAIRPGAHVLITPTGPTGGKVIYVSAKTDFEGFTVALENGPAQKRIDFDWLIVNSKQISQK